MNKLTDEDIVVAYNTMQWIDKVMKAEKKINCTSEMLISAKSDAIDHHIKFIKQLHVKQNKLDAYKICSWYGFYLAHHLDDPKKLSLGILLRILNTLLSRENGGRKLSEEIIQHLFAMTKNDGNADTNEFGVGKNGIYACFTACRDMCSATSKFRNGLQENPT